MNVEALFTPTVLSIISLANTFEPNLDSLNKMLEPIDSIADVIVKYVGNAYTANSLGIPISLRVWLNAAVSCADNKPIPKSFTNLGTNFHKEEPGAILVKLAPLVAIICNVIPIAAPIYPDTASVDQGCSAALYDGV